jgi:hypothetical protein
MTLYVTLIVSILVTICFIQYQRVILPLQSTVASIEDTDHKTDQTTNPYSKESELDPTIYPDSDFLANIHTEFLTFTETPTILYKHPNYTLYAQNNQLLLQSDYFPTGNNY